MNKRILLTGATGYLGSHLARALLDSGYSVVALKRKTSSLKRVETISTRITWLDVDVLDLNEPFKNLGKFEAVIHAATSYGRHGESASQLADANLNFPLKLLDAVIAADVPIFLNSDTALDKFINPYSISKTQFAEWGRYFSRQMKIRFFNLKLEHFYGEGDDDSKFTTNVIKRCLMNVPELKLTLGEQKRDFIYIDDVVAAYLSVLEKSKAETDWFVVLSIGSGEVVTIRQFVELVHQLTRSRTRLNFGAIPYREGEVMLSNADLAPLQKLGWHCRYTLEQGLKLVIEGHKQ